MIFLNACKTVLRTTLCIMSVSVGSMVLAQATQEKTTWTPAKPTKTAQTAVATDKAKPAVTIGKQREQEKPAAETPKKKSKTKSALKAAQRAAPELIKQAPALIQSIQTIASGGANANQAQPKTQRPPMPAKTGAEEGDESEEGEEEENVEEEEER